MSARDRLTDRNDPEWNAIVDEILAEHAHELAEKIRDSIGRTDHPNKSQRVKDMISMARKQADLIDPEVETK